MCDCGLSQENETTEPINQHKTMYLKQITDAALAQNAYLIACQRTGEAIIIDPERDVDRYLDLAAEQGFKIVAVADTHIHADYLSGARELVERHGAVAYLSAAGGDDWQFEWAKGHESTRFLFGGDSFSVGKIRFEAQSSPGHTPEHLSFLVTDIGGGASEPMALLSGDFIFVGDVGRPDLLESAAGQEGVMEPSARTLYASLRATAGLPDYLQILPAHGAGSACGKSLGAIPTSVLGYERLNNGALRQALSGKEEPFVREILEGQPEPPRYFARMKRENKVGPALLPSGVLPKPRRLTTDELQDFVSGSDFASVALDLRADREPFMHRHLLGSLWAPLSAGRLSVVAGSYLEADAKILLLVNDESEVDEAVRQLVRIGMDQIVAWIPVEEALAKGVTQDLRRTTTADLGRALRSHPGAAVLDVRGAGEFATGHVRGATNIAHTRLAARIDELPASDPLFVHCGSGVRAIMAVPFLARTGREVIYVDGNFADLPAELIAVPAAVSAHE